MLDMKRFKGTIIGLEQSFSKLTALKIIKYKNSLHSSSPSPHPCPSLTAMQKEHKFLVKEAIHRVGFHNKDIFFLSQLSSLIANSKCTRRDNDEF